MAVVRVRVSPAMLPPTMIAAPTSVRIRPKAVLKAASRPHLASLTNVQISWYLEAPKDRAVGLIRASRPARADTPRATTMGKASTAWATIIAPGVNSIPRNPRGPWRDNTP